MSEKGLYVHFPGLAAFLRRLGVVLGDWAKITGFLRKDRGRLPLIGYSLFLTLIFGIVLYSRFAQVKGAPTTYLYLEVGGSLLCFCYAANALVRFRGTHDRIALILAFAFVLSGMIETIGYFGLNDLLHTGQMAL
ncbi:MAG: hypothetical protein WB607_14940, partial [Candidatus Acidiferrum sp.]